MYLHAYGKSVIEIATNTISFVTEFLPFVITITWRSHQFATSFHR